VTKGLVGMVSKARTAIDPTKSTPMLERLGRYISHERRPIPSACGCKVFKILSST
jgi:hypothetical protein